MDTLQSKSNHLFLYLRLALARLHSDASRRGHKPAPRHYSALPVGLPQMLDAALHAAAAGLECTESGHGSTMETLGSLLQVRPRQQWKWKRTIESSAAVLPLPPIPTVVTLHKACA